MKKSILLAAAATVLVLAAPVSATTYHCTLTEQGTKNWIPRELILTHDENTGKVTVLDPLIQHYKGGPIPGKVSTSNGRRTTYAWVLDKITAKGGGQRQFASELRYRITIQKASHKATIWMQPAGYVNQFRGKGSCEVRN